jgi:DNA-binding beta-propeller fold protein YncE
MNFSYKIFIYTPIIFLLSCGSDEIVQYFEYTDHNVLNIGSQLTDLVITSDSNTLIAADKGNNQVRFIDVSTDKMSIIANVWVGSEPSSLELTADGQHLLVGLQGAASVAVVSVLDMELLGSYQLVDDDPLHGMFDIEYINTTDQLIASFVSSDPSYNRTKLYDLDNWIDFVATESTFEYGGTSFIIEANTAAGYISLSNDEEFLYVVDKYNGIDGVYKYNILENLIPTSTITTATWASPTTFSPRVGTIKSLHDIEYLPSFGVVIAVGGEDIIGEGGFDHSSAFDLDDLSLKGHFGVGSTPLALTYDPIGEHLYISPTDVDDNGVFIIEYSIQTQLQTNYYQVAGRLGSHALVVDPKGEYIYAAVDDLSDQDTDEPYNNSSFNIQRIKILPEGTYPAINDFE